MNFRTFQTKIEVYSFHPAQRGFKVPERGLERAASEKQGERISEYFI